MLGLFTLLGAPALACGGFFCDAAQPVDQAGERILFALDGEAGQVEMHVQVAYEGPPDEFSWLLPVPGEPEVLLSTEDVFQRIGAATAPLFSTVTETVGTCVEGIGKGFDLAVADSDDAGGGGVAVVQSQVGPYDVTVLQASDVSSLTGWLTENGYQLYPGTEDKLGPYVAEGMRFVALKLSKDRGTGDIVPVALRYAGTEPTIPLQITSVAAVDDMPIQPFVLGAARAVPENYLHVQINELLVDWTQAGANYNSVVSAAADAAGGQAFATDFAGETATLPLRLWSEGQYPIEAVRAATDATDLSGLLYVPFVQLGDTSWQEQRAFPVGSGTVPILSRFVRVPGGREAADFFSCIECFVERGEVAVDGEALATALEAEWVEPMRRTQELFDRLPWLTRLTSSMSAAEMTVDPRFVINPDMPAVSAQHTATMQVLCNGLHSFSGAPRRLVLADGRTLDLPSNDDASEIGFTWETWTQPLADLPAERVEQTGRSGDAVLVTDNSDAIDAALAEMNAGCGCDGTGGGAGAAGLIGLLALRRRVTRTAARAG
ncbi:MAG TPA: DUF2330 domain-containing protein [Myxococcota bacterium]|nr:DUF2330 domain-containing protein [Myxococcota bacterium]